MSPLATQIRASLIDLYSRSTISEAWLAKEERVVWVRPPDSVPWARGIQVWLRSRARIPTWFDKHGLILIGYSVIRADVQSPLLMRGRYLRRVFYHGNAFHQWEETHSAPANAVDCLTVSAGVTGHMTSRAWQLECDQDD